MIIPRRATAYLGSPSLRGVRIGILGGSFNPAHEGHLAISRAAMKRLRLDQIWWLVSPQNPLKSRDDMAAIDRRLDAARSWARDPRIWVSDLEAELGTSYTVDTIAALTARAPATHFVWLMGADNLAQFSKWRRWQQVFATVPVAVYARAPFDFRALAGLAVSRYRAARIPQGAAALLPVIMPPAWTFFALRRHPASATRIRDRGDWQKDR